MYKLKYRLDYGDGWYELENDGQNDFRWMKRKASCVFSGLDDSLFKVLRITAGHHFHSEKNPFLSVEHLGKLVQNIEIFMRERSYYIPLGTIEDELRIDFQLNKTFDVAVTNDTRTLGISVKKIELLNLHKGTYICGNGWYDEEFDGQLPFRWTDQSASILLSPDLLENYAFLQFYAESPFPDFSQVLEISINGQSIVELAKLQRWSSHVVNLSEFKEKLGINSKKYKTYIELNFLVNKTFDEKHPPINPRRLGIKLRGIEFHNDEKEYKIFSFFQGNSQLDSFPKLLQDGDYQKIKSYNFNKNLYEAKEEKTALSSFPTSLYVDVNLKCNLSCPSCFRSSPDNKDKVWPTMDFTLFEKIAHELFPTAYRVNLSGGGESTLNKNFEKIIELCLYYQVRPIIYTNATTLNRDRISLLARSGTVMGISIDGARKDTFEKLRYPAKWKTIIKALDTIKEVRDEIDNDEFYPYFGVVIQRDNIKELAAFVELAEHYCFDLIKFSRLDLYYPELEKKILDPEEADKELAKVLDMATNKRIRLYVPDYGDKRMSESMKSLRQKNTSFPIKMDKNNPDRFVKYPSFHSKYCQIPWSETLITPEGKVVVGCCTGFELGDINKDKFSDIWNNKLYKKLRWKVNSNKPMSCCKYDICYFRK
ncbi:MAG: radical SAM protein [Candidatus Aminicenantes bacterium]|nr:radical SAM protein [Candidatus Aminicenantes bacterium]